MSSASYKEYGAPIVVLTVICLVISFALAFTNQTVAPIIAEQERLAAEQGRQQVLPEADGFTQYEGELPDGVTEIYIADNGVGVVVTSTTNSYGGEMETMTGIDANGKITGWTLLTFSDTVGIGDQIQDESFYQTFIGKDSSLEGVSTIGGATVSSSSLIRNIQAAFQGYELVKGALAQ